jgi:transcription initiation protein SPT3
MFVFGETAEPCVETTGLIEEIVRQQVIERVIPLHHRSVFDSLTHQNQLDQATRLANRRGVKSISTVDLIFLIRHAAKVSRLKTFPLGRMSARKPRTPMTRA